MNLRTFCALALSAVVLAGCSDDVTGFNTDCSNLLGTFTATSATVTGNGTSTASVDLLADSSKFDLAFGQGTFSSSYRKGAHGQTNVTSGTLLNAVSDQIEITGKQLYPNGSLTSSFRCSIDGDVLTLEDANNSYNFPGQAEATPSHVKITAKRSSE